MASRYALGRHSTSGSWYTIDLGPYFELPDYLIIPDVRFPAEAAFCKEMGILIYLDGSHNPLSADLADHPSESHLQTIRGDADDVIPHTTNSQPDDALVRRVVRTLLQGEKEEPCLTK